MARGLSALRQRASAAAGVMRAKDLRRLQLGWAAYFLTDGISTVGLAAWAYQHDGTSAVGVLGVARLVPCAIALPFGAWAADRFSRQALVTAVFAVISATQVAIAIALAADSTALVVYALVAINSAVAAPYRPAHLALTPLVARSPTELVAINVTAGTLEGVVTFAGPAVAALLLIAVDPWFVLAFAAVAAAGGVLVMARLDVHTDPSKAERRHAARPIETLLGGVAELRQNRDLAVVVGCFVAQLLVRGFLNVLLVAVAFDLDLGGTGVGWLWATIGIGGIVGGVFAMALTGRRHMGRPFALALALWGAPMTVIGLWPNRPVAVAALFAVGVGNALLDVAGFTLMQRLGTDRALGRVFGVMFSVGILIGGLGSLAVPGLVSWLGLRPVLICVGLVLPTLAVTLATRFRAIDERSVPPPHVIDLMSRVPLLAPLPPTMLEKLAARSTMTERVGGDVVVAEGEPADLFYAIAAGAVDVTCAGRSRGTLGPGQHFGEIALLDGTTRTATVTATEPTTLLSIDGRDFVDALSSTERAFVEGRRVADERLDRDRAADEQL